MSATPTTDTFDVFVSYHSGDADWVMRLVDDLKSRGLSVWVDRDQIRPGDLFVKVLEDALAKVRCVLVVVSSGSLRSRWVQEESHRALDLINSSPGERRLICILIDDAEPPPGFLKNRTWVDFRDPARRAENLDQLIFGITGEKDGTSTTAAVPDYLRGEPPTPAAGPAIDEVEFLSRQIQRADADVRRYRRIRLVSPTPGVLISGLFLVVAPASSGLAMATALVGAPLITGLIAWSVTAAQLTRCEQKLQKYEVLRDGLELCRLRTNPGCRSLREKFWEIVLHQASFPNALPRTDA